MSLLLHLKKKFFLSFQLGRKKQTKEKHKGAGKNRVPSDKAHEGAKLFCFPTWEHKKEQKRTKTIDKRIEQMCEGAKGKSFDTRELFLFFLCAYMSSQKKNTINLSEVTPFLHQKENHF